MKIFGEKTQFSDKCMCRVILSISAITDAQTVISFLKTYGLDKDYKVRDYKF